MSCRSDDVDAFNLTVAMLNGERAAVLLHHLHLKLMAQVTSELDLSHELPTKHAAVGVRPALPARSTLALLIYIWPPRAKVRFQVGNYREFGGRAA
jgi:hypothetical protein